MTHRDTTMLERLNRVCAEELLKAGAIVCNVDPVRVILNELKQPSEGMVMAGAETPDSEGAELGYPIGQDAARECFTAMIDAILNEGAILSEGE
jgi:hypothetical protein